jgi:hypothetical protein
MSRKKALPFAFWGEPILTSSGNFDLLEGRLDMNQQTRREFVARALAAGAAWPLLRGETLLAASPPISVDGRRYAAGHHGLELNGVFAGWVSSVAQGHASTDVLVRSLNPQIPAAPEIAATEILKINPQTTTALKANQMTGGPRAGGAEFTLHAGSGMSQAFYQWIQSSLAQAPRPVNGAVLACDFNYQPSVRIGWEGGTLSGIVFPALDAASTGAASMGSMEVKISSLTTHFDHGGFTPPGPNLKTDAIVKAWKLNAFRCLIGGCEEDSKRISRVESIALPGRGFLAAAPSAQNPNLVVTVPENHIQQFTQWHQAVAMRGKSELGKSDLGRSATLDFLTQDMMRPLFSLTFAGLGIATLTPEVLAAGRESIRRVKVAMFSPNIQFVPGTAGWI